MSDLKVHSLTTGYGKVNVIRNISLEIAKGRCVALVGSNGAGKSTIVRAINGLLRTRAGSIEWGGQPIRTMRPSARTRAGIATVPEGRLLFPGCTVMENLIVAATWGDARTAREESLDYVYKLFPRLCERSHQIVGTLSGGEQQMVAIGRALMTKPQLLILDEPSIGLAPKVVAEIFEILGELTATGLSLLLVEQNVQLSLRSVDYGYVLRQGEIVVSGSSAELLDSPEVRKAYLGE
ncbi:MAG: ABC transporter ATP-binding protein [Desulfovibrionaceae bacterium]|jgi:branched-chain amino acid transport system ATP-binding protein|nr:ABC transporter ATP-binding protein [Desulfovibrionaceae bacterium]